MSQNFSGKSRRLASCAAVVGAVILPAVVSAQVVYSNNFQTAGSENQNLTASGTLNSLTRFSLPTDNGGINSANQSQWLGRNGYNVGKSSQLGEVVTLSLSGLVTGSVYNVKFDLLTGSSWDGSASGYGPDRWRLTTSSGASTSTLIDASFSICHSPICGAYSPQSYSDATPLGESGAIYGAAEGADAAYIDSYNYGEDYAIYYFGHGAGNPMLSFIAGASTADLVFERPAQNNGDSADEYWALDNIEVTGLSEETTPEPASLVLLGSGLAAIVVASRRRKAA